MSFKTVVIVAIGCLAVVSATMLVVGFTAFSTLDPFRTEINNPGDDFKRLTGLPWPQTATVISVGDDHGGFLGEGEFHLIFDTDPSTLESWLAGPPPWDQNQWNRGPVPTEIGFHCGFGTSGVATVSINGGPSHYSGEKRLEEILGSEEVWYAATERCCNNVRWHNGELLIIDPVNRRIWLSSWDY